MPRRSNGRNSSRSRRKNNCAKKRFLDGLILWLRPTPPVQFLVSVSLCALSNANSPTSFRLQPYVFGLLPTGMEERTPMATEKSSSSISRKKSAVKKSSSQKRSSTRKYGAKASKSVEREMKAFKQGKLKSGSGRKVTNPKQAIAIGLSEARKSGAKVPKKKSSSSK